jgi:RNA-directed DNA polymerase
MFEQLVSWENLLLAYQRAAAGKRGRSAAARFEHALEDNLLSLQSDLTSQTYHPGPYYSFFIHEPKRRLISAAPFRDRVAHHALCNVIEPVFERGFITDSYANRVGKGTHRALDRCQAFARRYRYCLQCDVTQFFPSLDHAVLHDTLARRIPDRRLMRLIDTILASGAHVLSDEYDPVYFSGDNLFAVARPRGLPIGNLTSQFWANCYLDPFDQFVKRNLRCQAYVRYVDDMLLFSNDKRQLADWHIAIIDRLAVIRLTIHSGAQPRPVTEGVSFLGFRVFPEHRRLKRRKGIFFARKYRTLRAAHRAGNIGLDEVTPSVQGWVNHVRYANTFGLRQAVLSAG